MFDTARKRRLLLAAAAIALAAAVAVALTAPAGRTAERRFSAALADPPLALGPPTRPPRGGHWIATWGASPMAASLGAPLSERGFRDQTLREVVFASQGGTFARVRFTNLFGATPLRIGSASLALQQPDGGAAVIPASRRQLLFDGRDGVTIPRGAVALSDPVALAVKPLTRLAISLYLPSETGPATEHALAKQTSWIAQGAHVLGPAAPFGGRTTRWFYLDDVQVYVPRRVAGSVVAIGDSITDGVGSQQNGDANWPDDLARRLNEDAGSGRLAVVDEGISGNRVLNDSPCCGGRATARFAPDVLSQPGVRDVILLEGINDIGYSRLLGPFTAPHSPITPAELIHGYRQIIAAAHRRGLKIFGGTLLPFKGAGYWSRAGETVREQVNAWILRSHAFDGVINFAAVMADPGHPQRLKAAYDSGDHLHPNDRGYLAMANAINLAMLRPGAAR